MGSKSPIRSGVILRNLKMRKGDYSYEDHEESSNKISTLGLFSTTDFKFTPRDSSALCDTLDLRLKLCIRQALISIWKPMKVKMSSGSLGPELILGFTKRNTFPGW